MSRHRRIGVDLPLDRYVDALSVELAVERETFRGLEAVPGTVEILQGALLRVEFTPLAPLAPQTRYVVRATTPECGLLAGFEFTTSDIGLRVDNPEEAVGHPFVGNAANASFARNSLAGIDLAPTGAIRFVIEDLSPSTMAMQSTRQPLDIYQGADPPLLLDGYWANPSFHLFGERFAMHLAGGVPVDLTNVELTGDLSPDRTQLAGLAVRGILDLRTIGRANPAELCGLLTDDEGCRACGDGARLCVLTEFRDWAAQRVDGSSPRP